MKRDRRLFLITGGSGFLGINLIRTLLRRGCRVRSIDIAPFAYPEKNTVDAILGDVRDRRVIDRAMRDVDVVVHCAAALPLYSREDIMTTEVNGTRIVLQIAARHAVERVIHISSTAVYGIPDHHPIYEWDRLEGVGPYGEAKILAERECLKARQRGLCVPILRPKSFVGPERLGVFALLYDWADSGKNFPILGSGKNRYQLLDVDDLCDFIYTVSMHQPATVNDTFNVGARRFKTIQEDFQAVLDEAGYGKKIIPIPAAPFVVTLKILEKLKLSPLYQWIYETIDKDSFVSVDKALSVGFAPKYSNAEALVRNFRWYREHVDQFQGKTGLTHRVPWSQGLLALAKVLF